MNTQEFANSIRQKFPDGVASDGRAYKDISDADLVQKIVAKYPVYATQISDLKGTQPQQQIQGQVLQGRFNEIKPPEKSFGQKIAGIADKVAGVAEAGVGGFASGVGGIALTAEDYLARKAVNKWGSEEMKRRFAETPTLNEKFKQEFGGGEHPNVYGGAQLAGEVATLAAPISAVGRTTKLASEGYGIGPKMTKLIQAGTEGLAFTAGQGLIENEKQTLSDYALNAGFNMIFPAGGMVLKLAGDNLAPRVINSIIKPLLRDFAYGKNPGRTIAQFGIVANNFDELVSKIKTKTSEVGQQIGTIISQSKSRSPIDLVQTLNPIDEAIKNASLTPRVNATLLQRLEAVKEDLVQNISMSPTIQDAQKFKGLIGDLTKWTGNVSDDAVVNKALKGVYSKIVGSMDDSLQKVLSPEDFAKYKKATEQYGDLLSAGNAAIYRDKILERQDMISFGAKNAGFLSALGTAIVTGGASIPTILAGLAGMSLTKAAGSTAFKTRLAALLSKLAPKEVTTVFDNVPAVRSVFGDKKKFLEYLKTITR